MADKKFATKKFLIICGIIALIVAGCLAALASVLNSAAFKDKIRQFAAAQVAEKLAMELVFQQDFHIRLFPDLGLYIQDIKLGPLAGKTPNIPLKNLQVARADIAVSLWSLISGNPQVQIISLIDVEMLLPPQAGIQHDISLKLSRVILKDFADMSSGQLELQGLISWADNLLEADISLAARLLAEKQLIIDIGNLLIKASLKGKPPLQLGGSGQLDLHSLVALKEFDSLDDIASFKLSDLNLSLDDLKLSANGQLELKIMQGQMAMQLHGSPETLLNFLQYEFASSQAGKNLNLQMDLSGEKNLWKINQLQVKLDDVSLRASGLYQPRGPISLQGELDLASLTLEDYLLKPISQAASVAAPQTPKQPAPELACRRGDSLPVLPPALLNAQLDMKISAQQLSYASFKLNQVQAVLRAENGLWQLNPVTALCLDGQVELNARADFKQNPPSLRASGQAGSLQLSALIPAVNGQVQKVDFNLSSGLDKGLLNRLNGSLSFSAANVSSSRLVMPAPFSGSQIVVNNSSGSFAIHNGVASSSNLKAQGPQLDVTGGGSVNLPLQSLDMDLLVKVAGVTIKGVDTIPIKISGPLAKPNIEVDMAKLAELTAKGLLREQIGNRIMEAPSGIGNLLQGIGGGR